MICFRRICLITWIKSLTDAEYFHAKMLPLIRSLQNYVFIIVGCCNDTEVGKLELPLLPLPPPVRPDTLTPVLKWPRLSLPKSVWHWSVRVPWRGWISMHPTLPNTKRLIPDFLRIKYFRHFCCWWRGAGRQMRIVWRALMSIWSLFDVCKMNKVHLVHLSQRIWIQNPDARCMGSFSNVDYQGEDRCG